MRAVRDAVFQYLRSIDGWLALLALSTSGVGFLLLAGIYHSGMATRRHLLVQLLATGLGVFAALVLSLLEYEWLAKRYRLYLPVGLGLVALTYIVGEHRADASWVDDRAWLVVPGIGMSFQPSELLKLAFILSFALHLSTVEEHIGKPATLFRLGLHGAVPTAMVMLQGDHGTALVFVFIFLVMLFAGGLPLRYLFLGAGAGAAAAPVVWLALGNDKRMRILSVFDHSLDPSGASWQQTLSARSIGSGQLWGKGLFFGEHNYVPEIRNDFIFAFAGEALGFVGCVGILALLGALCLRLLYDARRANDTLGRLVCTGIFAMLAFQIIVNVGMCLWLLPVVGITLPLLSAGGSSVLITYLALGLALSVYRCTGRKTLFLDN